MKFILALRSNGWGGLPGNRLAARLPWLTTFLLWAAVAASAVFWVFRWTDPLSSSGSVAQREAEQRIDGVALARWLGAGAGAKTASPLQGRFNVLGVVTDPQGVGAALIATEGRPARPYRVGAEVEPGLVVQKLQTRSVRLGATPTGPVLLELEMAAPKPATAAPPAGPAALHR